MNLQGFEELSFDESLFVNGGSLASFTSVLDTVRNFFTQITGTIGSIIPFSSPVTSIVNGIAQTIINTVQSIGSPFYKS
jgi:phage-related protein